MEKPRKCSNCYYWIDRVCRHPDCAFTNIKMLADVVCGNWEDDSKLEDEDGVNRTQSTDKSE